MDFVLSHFSPGCSKTLPQSALLLYSSGCMVIIKLDLESSWYEGFILTIFHPVRMSEIRLFLVNIKTELYTLKGSIWNLAITSETYPMVGCLIMGFGNPGHKYCRLLQWREKENYICVLNTSRALYRNSHLINHLKCDDVICIYLETL